MPFNIETLPNQLLYIDPWLSRQSEILCTERTSENKRKQSRGWKEMYECYEIIYTDGYGSLSLESVSAWSG